MKKTVAILPARMKASRFPGKPLEKILDLPLIEHVRRRVLLSPAADEVYVATCDNEIKDVVESYGGKAIMTSNEHERCTDRVEEAVRKIEADIVIIAQGDEPLFDPEALEKLVEPMLQDTSIECTNLISEIKPGDEAANVDNVKAVMNLKGDIMYFSRAPIPFFRVENKYPVYRQTGISAFTKKFLIKFSALDQTEKEVAESVDFLRILDHGYSIRGVAYPQNTAGVDRPEDVKKVEDILLNADKQRVVYEKILGMKVNQ